MTRDSSRARFVEHDGSMIIAALALVSFTVGFSFCAGGAPQVPDVVDVFFAAGSDRADRGADRSTDGGVVVCRVDVVGDHGWDTFGAVDLAVTLTIGNAVPVEVWGPEDRSSAVVSVPGVQLKPGQRITIDVEDRDVTGREPITRGVARYGGTWPVRFDLRDVQVECRVVDHAVAVARAAPALARARQALATAEAARPDLAADDLGEPRAAWQEAAWQAGIASSWLGDGDDDVSAVGNDLAAARAKFTARARADIVEAKAALPAPGGWTPMASFGVEARFVAGPSLVVEVRAPADGGPVALHDTDVAAAIALLDERARELVRDVVLVPDRSEVASDAVVGGDDGVSLAAGQVRRIRLKATSGRALPALARVDGVVVRLR